MSGFYAASETWTVLRGGIYWSMVSLEEDGAFCSEDKRSARHLPSDTGDYGQDRSELPSPGAIAERY